MLMDDITAAATIALLTGRGKVYFVAVALAGDVPVTEDKYLVMVNPQGDRVAVKYPGQEWRQDNPIIKGYNKKIPTYKNAIRHPSIRLENK